MKATGKPTIVVLVAGKPFAIPWVKDNCEAVIVQWYGGEQEGRAIAEILFGEVNPSGRLNVSFHKVLGICLYSIIIILLIRDSITIMVLLKSQDATTYSPVPIQYGHLGMA